MTTAVRVSTYLSKPAHLCLSAVQMEGNSCTSVPDYATDAFTRSA